MSNMSYCMVENTIEDIEQIYEAIGRGFKFSEDEYDRLVELSRMCDMLINEIPYAKEEEQDNE